MSDVTVLVIDDSREMREVARQVLEARQGVRVETTCCGCHAVESLARHQPSLFLVEVADSHHDANLEFIRKVKADPATKDTPILAFGYAGAQRHQALQAGCDAYLDKIDVGALFDAVLEHLDR